MLRDGDETDDAVRARADHRIHLGASDKYRYPKVIKELKRLREDYERAGDAAGFGVYLDGLQERQRRKYSFIAKLHAAFGAEVHAR